jgi:ankyrin repeat protein
MSLSQQTMQATVSLFIALSLYAYANGMEREREQLSNAERKLVHSYARRIRPKNLHEAVHMGSLPFIKKFLLSGADINGRSTNGNTPLHIAATQGNIGVIRYLLEHGAELEATRPDGSTVIHVAAARGKVESLDPLGVYRLEKTPPFLLDLKSQSLFILAQRLMNSRGPGGNTPLHLAARGLRLNMVRALLERGADLLILNEVGNTVLHEAVAHDLYGPDKTNRSLYRENETIQLELVKALISRRNFPSALVNWLNKNSQTALHLAVQQHNKLATELLLCNGADPDIQDWTGSTPLHYAARAGLRNIIEILRSKARKDIRNNEGNTPYDEALKGACPSVASLLSLEPRTEPRTNNNDRARTISWLIGADPHK